MKPIDIKSIMPKSCELSQTHQKDLYRVKDLLHGQSILQNNKINKDLKQVNKKEEIHKGKLDLSSGKESNKKNKQNQNKENKKEKDIINIQGIGNKIDVKV